MHCICRCPLPMILLAEEGCSTIVEVGLLRCLYRDRFDAVIMNLVIPALSWFCLELVA